MDDKETLLGIRRGIEKESLRALPGGGLALTPHPIALGSAFPLDEPLSMEVRGRNLIEGIPKTITITDEEIREALSDAVSTIINAVRVALERTPPELSADLVDRGFVMAGGGSLIRGIDRLLSEKTGLPVTVADDPLSAVANGTGAVLNDLNWVMQNV